MKSGIIEKLGQTDLLLPALIGEGLAANDRVKVRLSVLQAAARHARAPETTEFDLTEECRAAGIEAEAMQALVEGASRLPGGEIDRAGPARPRRRDLGRRRRHDPRRQSRR